MKKILLLCLAILNFLVSFSQTKSYKKTLYKGDSVWVYPYYVYAKTEGSKVFETTLSQKERKRKQKKFAKSQYRSTCDRLFPTLEPLPDGKWVAYFNTDTNRVAMVFHTQYGKKHGEAWLMDQKEMIVEKGNYRNDEKQGLWIYHNDKTGKKIREENYQDGYRDGKSTFYDLSGQLINESGEYKKGLLHGERIVYYPNGKIFSIRQYKEDTLNGLSVYYATDGKEMYKATYTHGAIIDGEERVYFPDGKLKIIGNRKNGKRHSIKTEACQNNSFILIP
jgi:antitoxin component YwqK of YwqJK toxin-antitoxin module